MGAQERTGAQALGMKPIQGASGRRFSISQILQSGVILSVLTFLANLGNMAFLAMTLRLLPDSEWGWFNGVMSIVGFLGLPLTIATTALTHYIARFKTSGDTARLQGLLAGSQKFLLHLTIAGSLLVIIVIKPLSHFFNLPRAMLALAALICVLTTLWGSLATALCQGMAWFKRFAFIGLLAAALRLAFGWFAMKQWPFAEWAVLASAVMVLANLVLFFWKSELAHPGTPVSPWNHDLLLFFIVSAACVGGTFLFNQGDVLVVTRNIPAALGVYSAAQKLAVALPLAVGPLLIVLFSHRSSQTARSAVREQFRLLALYTVTLLFGALCLYLLRDLCVRILGGKPAATALVGRLALTMVFVGLNQSLGMWALASRWFRVSLLYGALGLGYWLTLLVFAHDVDTLLTIMPVAAALAFVILLPIWFLALKAANLGKTDAESAPA
jgi:O-antigen/teichoic acid export membrane protein